MLIRQVAMNIVCVTNCDYDKLEDRIVDSQSLTVIAYGVIKSVNLVAELEGRTITLKKLAIWSKKKNLIIIAGIDATINDETYCSAVVIDNGAILGISDMTHILSGDYRAGNSLRLYDTSKGLIGIIIGDDIFYPECIRALTMSGASMLVYLANKKSTRKAMISSSAASMLNGVYCIAQTLDQVTVFDCYGKMIIRSAEDILREKIEPEVNDTFISSRREEVYKRVFLEGSNDKYSFD